MRRIGLRMAAALLVASPALASEARQSSFGKLPDGRDVAAVTLTNSQGVSARVIAYGASLQSLVMPDRNGIKTDVALGYDSIGDYLAKPQYFGATVGRVANRIARGQFTLDGHSYQTPVNNGVNSLHGGTKGFDKVLWDVVDVKSGPTASVTLRYVSPDGEMGYPGTVTVLATYSLDEQDTLTIDYRATTDKTTVVNISNHTYWNLSGEGSSNGAMSELVTIPADTYLPTDDGAIPTGEFRPVDGTVFDFRAPRAVGERVRDASDPQIVWGHGYDHNWVISPHVTATPHLMAKVSDPKSGRGFTLWSNQPGLQFYSGNFLDGTTSGKAHSIYREGDAIVMEPQLFPDVVNRPAFGSARLEPGQTYHNVIVYRLTTGQPARH